MASAGGINTNEITQQPSSRFSLQMDARPLQVELMAGSLPGREGVGGHWSKRRDKVDRYGWTTSGRWMGDDRVDRSGVGWMTPRAG